MKESLESLSKEQLIDLVEIMAKNVVACDGVWFQAVEREEGMDAAVHYDEEAWKRFMPSEARRLKQFLGYDEEHPGLEALAEALKYRCTSIANVEEMRWLDDGSLVFRIVDCRVQTARKRKGMEFHPCKSVGEFEYGIFASSFDSDIKCECLSCFPDITDETCNCSWRFWID